MSGDKVKSPCNKFQANIFNKSKCQNCFKSRELHLLTDHGNDKAKPVYGGWLCIAPTGTDFDNPVQRSRKWQRRFFILYEHGSLSFALDELPCTLPQGSVNMNQCTDVVDAQPRTGQRHALCIVSPGLELYIRGESREIINGWSEQLAVYPLTNKLNLKKKRKVEISSFQELSPAKMTATEFCFPDLESPIPVFSPNSSPSPNPNPSSSPNPISSCTSGPASSMDSLAGGDIDLCPPTNPSPDPLTSEGQTETNTRSSVKRNDTQKPERRRRKEAEWLDQGKPVRIDTEQEFGQNTYRKGRSHQREKLQSCAEGPASQLPLPPPQRRAKSLDRRTTESTMTPDLLNFKKGWMVKLDEEDQWRKFWFVLSADSLLYYKDSLAEEASDLDGEIDLTGCHGVSEYQVPRNYGFQIHTLQGVHTLSAMTAGIRRKWIQALMKNVRPSNAPDVASLPGLCPPCSPPEALPRPDVTQESRPTGCGPKPREGALGLGLSTRQSRVRERRQEGRSKTFDWAEFRPLAQLTPSPTPASMPAPAPASISVPAPAPASISAPDPAPALTRIGLWEQDGRKRREDRRRRYDSLLSFPLGWELEDSREEGPSLCSPQAQKRVQEEIERCWQQVERTVFRADKTVPLQAETRRTVPLNSEPPRTVPPHTPRTVPLDLDPPSTVPSQHEDQDTDHLVYQETSQVLLQQDVIRQNQQQQLDRTQSLASNQEPPSSSEPVSSNQLDFLPSALANKEQLVSPTPVSTSQIPQYSDPKPPRIWLHDTEGNLQELGGWTPVCPEQAPTSTSSPVLDSELPHTPQPHSGQGVLNRGPDLDTALDRGGHQQGASRPETNTGRGAWSSDLPIMEVTGEMANNLADNVNIYEVFRSREEQTDSPDLSLSPEPGLSVGQLSQEVSLLTRQNQALDQRNQEMVNQLTEADREIERLRAELSVRLGQPQGSLEEKLASRARAEGLEAELRQRTHQLQEAQFLLASLEERLRDTETRLQVREAMLQGLSCSPETGEEEEEEEEEGKEEEDWKRTEEKVKEKVIREKEDVGLKEEEEEEEKEKVIWRLHGELEKEKLMEEERGEKGRRQEAWQESGSSVSGDGRIEQVMEEMVLRSRVMGGVLEMIDRSSMSLVKVALDGEEDKVKLTVANQLQLEEEFWATLLIDLKGNQSQDREGDGRTDRLVLSEVVERVMVEKQMLLLAYSLTQSHTDTGAGEDGMNCDRPSKDSAIGTDQENGTSHIGQHDTDDITMTSTDTNDVIGRFTEVTRVKMSLLNHIVRSLRCSANEQLRPRSPPNDQLWFMATRLSKLPSLQSPGLSIAHLAAAETLTAYLISMLQAQHQREHQRARQGLLSPSLPCRCCLSLGREDRELRGSLAELGRPWGGPGGHGGAGPEQGQGKVPVTGVLEPAEEQMTEGTTQDVSGQMEARNPKKEGTVLNDGQGLGRLQDEGSVIDNVPVEEVLVESLTNTSDCPWGHGDEQVERGQEVGSLKQEEDVLSLRARVRDLEMCLSLVVEEMRAEHDGKMVSLQLQQEQDTERLKSNYEQGLTSVEESHQRVLEEMSQRHRRDLASLRRERDRLLEEETAATVTAIAAMKSAYRVELEREVQRAVQEHRSRGHSDLEDMCRQHSEELGSCQRELEVLSQQYCLRCVEAVDLEQTLESHRHTLRRSQQDNHHLRTRHQELSAQLAAEITRLRSPALQASTLPCQDHHHEELEIRLRVTESELQCVKQEMIFLRDQLESAHMDQREAIEQYQDLSAELGMFRTRATRDLSMLRENLQLAHKALVEAGHTHNGTC
ncbi:uncharacterized protein LOC124479128 isoform X2 [Hypomesus transpacificus]|uniref:uncharacterized protein LOC124479128 isoform X2 n=1 Tax=Hypomesus transpacificus TaxID=137520 RepID=UPI001F087F55|nr:uncharacterized protein LOC124479128 isoform X2 [Hypomesus transpacificus]